MRSQGISVLKTQEIELVESPVAAGSRKKIELVLSSEAPVSKRRRSKKEVFDEPLLKDKGFKGYSEEELLAWSSAPVGGEVA